MVSVFPPVDFSTSLVEVLLITTISVVISLPSVVLYTGFDEWLVPGSFVISSFHINLEVLLSWVFVVFSWTGVCVIVSSSAKVDEEVVLRSWK